MSVDLEGHAPSWPCATASGRAAARPSIWLRPQAMDIPASTSMTPVNVLENVRRAQRGTAAAAHSAGEAVYVWDQPLHMAVAHEFGHALMSEAHQDDEHATGGVMFFQQQRGGPPFYADETRKFLDCVGRYQ
jgi:hypothetical protein